MRIRPIDPKSHEEIALVATRMRETLVEVLGEEKGGGMYTMEWLIQRASFHLDPTQCDGQILLAENDHGLITGHTIVRIDRDEQENKIGLFSTTYVVPEARRSGTAKQLLAAGEKWMQEKGMTKAVTYTDDQNSGLQNLFISAGYSMRPLENNFVELYKSIES